MTNNIKRLLHLFLTFLLILNLGIGVDIPVYADSTMMYNYENYTIKYTVKTEWTSSQDVGVTVKNTSEEPLRGWAFEFDAGGDIREGTSGSSGTFISGGHGSLINSTSFTNILEGAYQKNDGDYAGSYYNREFASVLDKYNEFEDGKVDDLDRVYDLNYALTRQLPINGIQNIIHTFKTYNWYNLYYHNCIDLAIIAWNDVYIDSPFEYVSNPTYPPSVKIIISEQPGSYVFNIHQEVLGIDE
jgi:hypothetical protein